jgi:nudix-type nucleoside diphosphatase (YffH/AdpP family)
MRSPDTPSNDRVKIVATDILFDGWAVLKRVTFDYLRRDGRWDRLARLAANHGDAAAVLPYDPDRGVVLLVRQFRLPAYLNGHPEPVLEVCAGRLDEDDPAGCAIRETREELGYQLASVEAAFTYFASPAFDTEKLTGFIARYSPADRVDDGGGLVEEGEDIEVIEIPFDEAFAGIAAGTVVDAKTILLLQHLKLSGLMERS